MQMDLAGGVSRLGYTVPSLLMDAGRALILVAVIGVPLPVCAQQNGGGQPTSQGYNAAFYSSGAAFRNEQRITVFPLDEETFSIRLPFALGPFAFSADGKVLYGEAMGEPQQRRSAPSPAPSPRLYKIVFNPTLVSPVEGSEGLRPIYSIAVSRHQDKIVISGINETSCGIFELNLSQGKLKRVLDNPDCLLPGSEGYLAAWLTISLSPDGQKAVAIRKHRLELIDLTHATVRALGGGFVKAAWSPDGKWIAALQDNGSEMRTVLMDTSSFVERRILGESNVEWSPDSRYLLAAKDDDHCAHNFGTLEAMDVETGKRTTIDSSRCKVNEVTTAWVSREIDR